MTDKQLSKTEILNSLSESSGLSRKDVQTVLDDLETLIEKSLNGSSQTFTLPGMVKFYVHRKKATEARTGRNPSNGQPIQIAAQPERNVVKVKPLKRLQDMAPAIQ